MSNDLKIQLLIILLPYFTLIYWRMTFRLKIFIYFFMSIGLSLLTVGGILSYITQEEYLINQIFLYGGAVLFFGGYLFLGIKYSGLEKEIKKRTTFLQRMTGNVPKDIETKDYPPGYTQTFGIFMGILIILEGIITYFYPKYFGSNRFVNIIIITIGIIIIVLTSIYIKSSTQEEHNE